MIRFLKTNDDGTVRVACVDWFHRYAGVSGPASRDESLTWYDRRAGELEFDFRSQWSDEPLQWYFDRIMNEYYWRLGKNKRRYQDE